MIEFRLASAVEQARWLALWQERLSEWYGQLGVPTVAERRLKGWADAADPALFTMDAPGLDAGAEPIGFLAVGTQEMDGVGDGVVHDIWVDPAHRGRGYGRGALDHAEQWCRERGTDRFGATVSGGDPAAAALFARYPLRSQRMVKRLVPNPPLPPGLALRPMSEAEYPAWLALQIKGYADDISGSGSLPPEQALARSRKEFAELLPAGTRTEKNSLWVLDAAGDAAGVAAGVATGDATGDATGSAAGSPVAALWLAHGLGVGLSFVYALEVEPDQRGRGYGRAIMLAGEGVAFDSGDTHLGLNVFGHNTAAIGLYTNLDYATVEQSRIT